MGRTMRAIVAAAAVADTDSVSMTTSVTGRARATVLLPLAMGPVITISTG